MAAYEPLVTAHDVATASPEVPTLPPVSDDAVVHSASIHLHHVSVNPTAAQLGQAREAAVVDTNNHGHAMPFAPGTPLVGGFQSDGYVQVSTSCPQPAYEMSGGTPPLARHWSVGEDRLKLRQEFNMKEVDAAKLVKKYDKDGSKTIECDELTELLRDYNQGNDPRQDDVQYFMKVADQNNDQQICQGEVLLGLRAWHAFNNMPKSVGATFAKHKLGSGPLPSLEKLRDILEILNGSQPVPIEETAWVRRTALDLGATEARADYESMRKAVAVWYLHLERGPTTDKQFRQQAVLNAKDKLVADVSLLEGKLDPSKKHTQVVLCIVLSLGFVFPLFEMWYAATNPTPFQCEHPHLSTLMWYTGLMMLVLMASIVGVVVAWKTDNHWAKVISASIFGTILLMNGLMEIFGYVNVMSATTSRCGFMLWQMANFIYLVLPLFFLVFCCCGIPYLLCVEYFANKSVDDDLQKESAGP